MGAGGGGVRVRDGERGQTAGVESPWKPLSDLVSQNN